MWCAPPSPVSLHTRSQLPWSLRIVVRSNRAVRAGNRAVNKDDFPKWLTEKKILVATIMESHEFRDVRLRSTTCPVCNGGRTRSSEGRQPCSLCKIQGAACIRFPAEGCQHHYCGDCLRNLRRATTERGEGVSQILCPIAGCHRPATDRSYTSSQLQALFYDDPRDKPVGRIALDQDN